MQSSFVSLQTDMAAGKPKLDAIQVSQTALHPAWQIILGSGAPVAFSKNNPPNR